MCPAKGMKRACLLLAFVLLSCDEQMTAVEAATKHLQNFLVTVTDGQVSCGIRQPDGTHSCHANITQMDGSKADVYLNCKNGYCKETSNPPVLGKKGPEKARDAG